MECKLVGFRQLCIEETHLMGKMQTFRVSNPQWRKHAYRKLTNYSIQRLWVALQLPHLHQKLDLEYFEVFVLSKVYLLVHHIQLTIHQLIYTLIDSLIRLLMWKTRSLSYTHIQYRIATKAVFLGNFQSDLMSKHHILEYCPCLLDTHHSQRPRCNYSLLYDCRAELQILFHRLESC